MKKFNKFLSLFLLAVLLCSLSSCEWLKALINGGDQTPEWVDYASQAKLDMDSPTYKWEVTIKQHIDGDTTHFYINQEGNINNITHTPGFDGVLKARYLGINTPESTGKIEPWGKKASNFTKSRIESADSIIIESDDANWNVDSTGERFLVWVWYRPAGETEYKNLNLEILQEGLAWSSKATTGLVYSNLCAKAVQQAYEARQYVYAPATELDPEFPYGDAQFMTLKELKLNIEEYVGKRVAFEGVIVKDSGGSIFIESYDEVDGIYYGISAYYLTSGLDGDGLAMLKIGNKIRFAGVVGEFGGSYQITDLKYDIWKPNDSKNMELISEGNPISYQEVTGDYFLNGKVTIELDGDDVASKTYYFKELAQDASISMKNLTVTRVYTTQKGNSKGAISITCRTADGKTLTVRTVVLKDENGSLITEDIFVGKVIDVNGTIDYYLPEGQTVGSYQIQLHSIDDVTFHE